MVSGINAFMLGAQSVDPTFKIKIVWVNTWFDPGKEADAAKALIAQGADIIAQHTDSAAPLQEAEKAGKLGFGQSSDMITLRPARRSSPSLEDNWGPYYVQRGQGRAGRHLEVARHLGRASRPAWSCWAPYTNMPDDVKEMAEDTARPPSSPASCMPFDGPDHQAGRHASP